MPSNQEPHFDGGELYLGLGALHWASLDFSNPGPDYSWFRRRVMQGNGPSLDVGCGTGRLLIPLVAEGLAVEGVDVSDEMLACCRARAGALNLKPVLHCQPMQRLDLGRQYSTLYIACGAFVLIVRREEALAALRRFRAHLSPGGLLVFNLFLPWTDLPAYPLPPDPGWEPRGDHPARHPEGDRIVVHRRVLGLDPARQILTEERCYRLYRGDILVREEIRQGQETWYSASEIRLMLEVAGFRLIEVTGDYGGEPLSDAHRHVMVVEGRA